MNTPDQNSKVWSDSDR